jgi:hypothetical protein
MKNISSVLVALAGALMLGACGGVPEEFEDVGDMPQESADGSMKAVEQTLSGACTGWHKVVWPTAGLRRWNASTCGGTVHCTLYAGDMVYTGDASCSVGGCDAVSDIYVHNTRCGFGGWVRIDALN